jgi:hypothetical protein
MAEAKKPHDIRRGASSFRPDFEGGSGNGLAEITLTKW